MILPHTNTLILVLMAVSMFCMGSWAITYKLANWRFELYYIDFALGVTLFTIVYAVTWGNMGYDGFGFIDSIMNAGKEEWLYAFGAGALFYFGNMLLLAVVASAGMMVAFPLAMGAALIVGAVLGWFSATGLEMLQLGGGCALVLAAIAAGGFAYRMLFQSRHEQVAREGYAETTRRPTGLREVIMAVGGGVLLGFVPQIVVKATFTDVGLGPYAVWFFFGFGMAVTNLLGGGLLLNFSGQGEALTFAAFVRSSPKQHAMGVLGGAVWCTGAVAAAVAVYSNVAPGILGGLPAGATPTSALPMYALRNSAALLAALWGIVVWREGKGSDLVVKLLFGGMLLLFAGGVAMLALSKVSYG
jgi:glucose uptake protein